MSMSRAVILAAGSGTRLKHLTADRPKAMLDVGGRSLIERCLDAVTAFGVRDVTVVVGHRQDRLREHLGARVRYIENDRYLETNSVYSLWLARECLLDGAVIMNSDVLVSRELVGRLFAAPAEDAVLIDPAGPFGEEEMKVRVWNGFAVDFSKTLPAWESHGENVGILKFGREGGRRLVTHLDALIAAGDVNAWAPKAVRALAQEWPIRAITTGGIEWTEIDFPADLERARKMVAVRARRSV